MAHETIRNIKSLPEYNVGGISKIWILNIDDFITYRFSNDKLYNQGLVEKVVATSPFLELDPVSESNFSETWTNNMYRQELNTFAGILKSSTLTNLLYAKTSKYLVAFRTIHGRNFIFGADGGASLSFSQQTGKTGEVSGYNIGIAKNSVYPLFELSDLNTGLYNIIYEPHFSGEFCQILNGRQTGYEIASYVIKKTADGQAIDINGNLCSSLGLKQAIQVLDGTSNPDEWAYEIESTYSENHSYIDDCFLLRYNPEKCPSYKKNTIWLDESQIIFDETTEKISVKLHSFDEWELTEMSDIVTCCPVEGEAGEYTLTFAKGQTRVPSSFTFQNTRTKDITCINIVNNPGTEWVLKDGKWLGKGYWLKNKKWE